ncbi:MAG: sodium:solute symporter family protein, partial [Rickettsiaceae bacterium]|nr:sodium:solute symporter family protein [Rickettsiaceae bacterium]
MEFNADIAIVICFLLVTLFIGMYCGRGIKTIKEYALGNRTFNTTTLAATILATWTAGSDFTITITGIYTKGIWYFLARFGDALNLLVIGLILAPRLKNFFGSLSVAETMGIYYGKYARIITAVASICIASGAVACQITIFSMIFSYFLDINNNYILIASSIVLVVYSSFGGIKAVTFTDVFQFLTFGISIPVFALFIWQIFGDIELAKNAMEHPLFNPSQTLKINSPKMLPSLNLFLCFVLPALNPTMFQRILMAKDEKQIKYSFVLASLISLIIFFMASFISFIAFSHNPNIEQDNLIMYIIDTYSFPELKVVLMLGIIAMVMSTADSWLNAGSVIFAHDICNPLGIKLKNELTVSKNCTIFMGIFAILLATASDDLLALILLIDNFYMPVVTVPLAFAIFGFRTTARPFLISVFIAIFFVIIWRAYIQPITDIDSLIPGMLANLIAFLSTHYLLQEPGGWVKNTKEGNNKDGTKKQFREFLKNLPDNISKFNLLEFCRKGLPYSSKTYIYFSIATFLTLITTISIDKVLYQDNFY